MSSQVRFGRQSSGGGGTGLTPAQIAQLNKSGKYQGEWSGTTAFLQGETVYQNNAFWEKLNNSPASTTEPYNDLVNWKHVEGEQLVTGVPSQPVDINSPIFIFDTVTTRRYWLDLSATNGPIYNPADGSVTGSAGTNIQYATTQIPAPAGMAQLTATANPNEWQFPAGITYVPNSIFSNYGGAALSNGQGLTETATNLITFDDPAPDTTFPARVQYEQA